MNTFFIILSSLLVLPGVWMAQIDKGKVVALSGNWAIVSAKSDQKGGQGKPVKSIEDYEKQKLAQMKKNIGRRLMAVRTARPAEFYESPDNLEKKISIKEKEEFLILDVVQNKSGTMNFYKVRLESGKTGYLGADGSNLELRLKDGSIMTLTKKLGKKESLSVSRIKEGASKAIELVRNHLIPSDPISKDKRSIERRMVELKATSFPNLKWRYEAKEIGSNKFNVTQYTEGESDRVIVRTWTVDLPTSKVSPENAAAKALYR
jgi:hypothetical protein